MTSSCLIRNTVRAIRSAIPVVIPCIAVMIACNGKSTETPAVTYQLTLLAGTGGTIASPSHSSVTMGINDSIAIAASPDAGYTFLKWTSATEGAVIAYKNAASTTVRLVQGNDTVQAVFVPVGPGLTSVNRTDLGRLEAGVSYNYYTGIWTSLPDFSVLVADASDSCNSFDVADVPHRPVNFGIVFSGYIDIPFDDKYTFFVKSSDGSALVLNDSIIIDNDGIHPTPVEAVAAVDLAAGKYLMTVRYFNTTSTPVCTISYACPDLGIEKQTIANGILSRPYTGPVPKIIITGPAGGETFYLGDTLHVRWIYRHFDNMVYCGISTDSGKSYSLLSINAFGHTDTNGHMEWKIPMNDSMITSQARIKISDYPPGTDFCVSNVFSIDSAAK